MPQCVSNAVHLITYPGSLGGDIQTLHRLLRAHYGDALRGIHLLPFYPSSADRGFAPIRYDQVDPAWGSWADVEALTNDFELTVDFMINHLSRRSPEFQDFVARKEASPARDLFIRYSTFWGGREPTQEQLDRIYKRKPRDPCVEVQFEDGATEKLWCTFDEEQIDLDWSTERTREFAQETIRNLCAHGAALIRLDAFAYAGKRAGTSCFFVEPEVWEILGHARDAAAEQGASVLPELHEHFAYQIALARHGYPVYDFALPMLVLHALFESDTTRLRQWFQLCPRDQITTLDTHDGIGVVDVRDLLTEDEIDRTKETLFRTGANVKRRYNAPSYNNLDIYQINTTYYSALGNDDEAYLLARAIQLFWPGTPQIYYVGLLAGENDIELVERTKTGRDINRHDYTEEEFLAALERPVVQRLRELLRFRNRHPAFSGDPVLLPTAAPELRIRWDDRQGNRAQLHANLGSRRFEITYTKIPGERGAGSAEADTTSAGTDEPEHADRDGERSYIP
jgi:sucrose phosphorylase